MRIKYLRQFFLFVAGMGFGAMLGFFGPTMVVALLAFGLWVWAIPLLWEELREVKRIRCLVVVGTFILSLLITMYLPPKLDKPQIDESKIQLFLQYAYEWDNYLGSENKPNEMSRVVSKPIEAIYAEKEYRLLLGVSNDNQPKLPITNVWLHVAFFDDSLTVRAETPWRSMRNPNKDAFTLVSPIINSGQGIHPNDSLWIRFPKPGIYTIGYEIKGANFEPISGIFKIYLKTESSSIDDDVLGKLKIVETLSAPVSSSMRH